MTGKLKIVAMSDLHGYLPKTKELQPADIAIIGGDIVPLEIQRFYGKSLEWYKKFFMPWVDKLPVDHVFMIAGNHDYYLERLQNHEVSDFEKLCETRKLTYLDHSYFEYTDTNGLLWTLFGTPYCKIFGNWPFMKEDRVLVELFKAIPHKVDIIIAHNPPFAMGDCDIILERPIRKHVGNNALTDRLKNVDYKILFCGHIHSGGHELHPVFKTVNVSLLNEQYQPYYPSFYTEIDYV